MSANPNSRKVKAMEAHIRAICAYHGIRIDRHHSGLSCQETKTIFIRPVRSEVTYAVALHEIGHIIGSWQTAGTGKILREAGAWLWAMKNAMEWTERMDRTLRKYLRTYFVYADRETCLPAEGHPSWKVLGKTGARPPRGREKRRLS